MASSAGATDCFESTARSDAGKLPPHYVPSLVSNGGLSLLVDFQGCQFQRSYEHMTPGIWWAGRRYGPGHNDMVPFGHFEQELSAGGKMFKASTNWTQSLNTKDAVVTCRSDYGNALTVESVVFTHLAQDLVVVKKRIFSKDSKLTSARLAFKYQFTPPGNDNRIPRRTICTSAWNQVTQSVDFRYQVDGHRPLDGIISVFADKPVTATIEKQLATLTAEIALPGEITFYLQFADSMDGKDFLERAAKLKTLVSKASFDGMLASHRQEWSKYWDESYMRVPDEQLQKVYCTAQYHLRANATKWSFPVGIFPTHWAGKFFGWDEMFCYQALISSNHRDIARRCPEFRCATLPKALDRASHYGKPGNFGARYVWESLEDGTEGAPPGFWMDHVFHISNIALSTWFQYLYTSDTDYLKKTGYPVIKECARFFLANMIYEAPDGGMFFGKCTDLERLGPARLNPFMTSCGAIYTLESAAQAAALLGADEAEAAAWKRAAAKLRESLPHDGEKYIPYPGCKERSVAALGGLFPYPVFDASNERQRKAVLDFVAMGRASGNMYPVGNSVCAWYAGWMAAALAALGERAEPLKLLDEAAAGAGCFGEMFEINEAKVSMHPWFATASGNMVYALNQMLVQSRGNQITLAPAVPADWKDFSFKLACHGDLVVDVVAKDGKLTQLSLIPGNAGQECVRSVLVPQRLLDARAVNRSVINAVATEGDYLRLETRFKGRAELVLISDRQLRVQAEAAWCAAWDRFFDERTHLFYDYVCSYDPAKRLAALPTPTETAQQNPNPNGWGTGMEDCAISGGLMLAMVCDRFAATGDTTLRPFAQKVFAGLKALVESSATAGFVCRGLCPADRKSHYPESSRDQYTWYVYGLWRYYHAPLAQADEKAAIRKLVSAVCARMERNIVRERNYSIGKDTGTFDGIVDKMWENMAHEVARLPMIYAIGADVTGDKHWKDLARRYSAEAAAKSKEASTKIPYALLQQQTSLEVLYQLEDDPALKKQWLEAMRLVAERAQGFFAKCLKYQAPTCDPIHFDWREWPLKKSGPYSVPTRPEAFLAEDRTIREPAEAALVQLLLPEPVLTLEQLALVKWMIAQVDYDKVVYYGHYYTQAVYWRAVRCGLLKLPAKQSDGEQNK